MKGSARSTFTLASLAFVGCSGPSRPARLVAGLADTVVINNAMPVRMPMHVFDRAGRELPDSGIQFEWTSGARVPISSRGVVHCTQAGETTIRASLGVLVTHALVRCRPVKDVYGGGTLNMLVGDSSPVLAFSPVDSAGHAVKLFTMGIDYDSSIFTLDRWRLHAHAPGEGDVNFYIGDGWAHWHVHVYAPAQNLDGMRPGDHRAVPVRLAGGEMLRLDIPASPPNYSVTLLPGRDTLRVPRLTVLASNCNGGLTTSLRSYWCFGLHGAAVVAYHPKTDRPNEEWNGVIAVHLDPCPEPRNRIKSALCPR